MSDLSRVFAVLQAEVEGWDERVLQLPVTATAPPAEIRTAIAARFDFARPTELTALTRDVMDIMHKYSVHGTHPRHFGLFNPATTPASVVADALTALYNPQVAAWWYAPAASEIERHTLQYFLRRAGYDPKVAGAVFTSGGSEANMTACVKALDRQFPTLRQTGLRGLQGHPTFYASSKAHDSLVKIAHIVGLGRHALRRIPADADGKMDVVALKSRIAHDRREGFQPFLVVATAGTTAAGVIDPLDMLADVCRREDLWLHADAAWGGGALLSDRLRRHLRGIERADSITWDAHKWLPVAMGAGMFLCKDQGGDDVFSVDAAYVPDARQDVPDLYKASILWSRRFMGLKVFMTLAERGEAGIAALADHQAAMGDLLRDRLLASGWHIANKTPLPVVCFTDPALAARPHAVTQIVQGVLARGQAWISDVRSATDQPLLRACITNHRTMPRDVEILVSELDACRREALS